MKLAELFAAPFKGAPTCSSMAEQNIRGGPIVKASVPYWRDIEISHLALHSQKVKKGSLFFALWPKWQSSYQKQLLANIKEALERGAKAIIIGQDSLLRWPSAASAEQEIAHLLSCYKDGAFAPASFEQTIPSKGEEGARLYLIADDIRALLGRVARNFYAPLPSHIIAITGTSGKSSVVSFLRQIWQNLGLKAASLGTLGIEGGQHDAYLGLTTPDILALYENLARLAEEGISHIALEASSHGIDQGRLDNLPLKAAGFTNLGRDHLDYHRDYEEYFAAKARLFTDILPPLSPAIIDIDDAYGAKLEQALSLRQDKKGAVLKIGAEGDLLQYHLPASIKKGDMVSLRAFIGPLRQWQQYSFISPLNGQFQIRNLLLALAIAHITTQRDFNEISAILPQIKPVAGRLQLIAELPAKGGIYIDYAHKPEALRNLLTAMRNMTQGRVLVVFGCGGDRDKGKRPLMGEIAQDLADIIIITDDNPRFEEPALIRQAILAKAAKGMEIGDRRQAIKTAISLMKKGDNLVIAGKGHEKGQIIGDEIIEFCDEDVVKQILAQKELV